MTDENNPKRGTSYNNQNQRNDKDNTDHTPTNPSDSTADNGPSSSLAGRIHNSASGLARSAFSASASASADAATLLAGGSGSKAGPSASSRAALSAAQRFDDSGAPTSSSARGLSEQSASGETFRSSLTTSQQVGGFALPSLSSEEFQSSYCDDPLSESTINSNIRESQRGKGKAKEINPSTRPYTTAENAFPQDPTPQATYSPLPTDGAAVTSLLSSSTFDPEFPPLPHETFEPIETDLSLPHLTAEEIQTIDSFRREMSLPPNTQSQTQPPHRLTPYSLVPDIDTILNSAAPSTDSDATVLRDTVLTSLPGSADWVAVDERYHDEVWGYLRPALEAARVEMEAKKEGEREGSGLGKEEDGPAVRRLKMILKHMGS
ncbi:uncharacterized protein KD926_011707 [Aspergillus affinis]|uniref:uncharacterized protein n=1 Tax=Aspergillus affinis TaxID=1070780 RepID=UPI0022FDD1FD|nr:uncharacterized protein KD926_011707 [Aspergillus affinis]KAI9044737.1 hypothetical protein KD926_011707 [Aspergillus affinis]